MDDAVAPRHASPPTTSIWVLNRGKHAGSVDVPEPTDAAAYPVSISLGSPARGPSGTILLSNASVYQHEFLEKEVVVTISPREPDADRPILGEGAQGMEDLWNAIEAVHSVPPLLPAQEYLFVVDCSTSMTGARIDQVRNALSIMLKSLPGSPIKTSFVSHYLVYD
jgi:hypothetical protein